VAEWPRCISRGTSGGSGRGGHDGAPERAATWYGRLAFAYALWGRRDSARKIVRELTDRSRREYIPSFQFALAYAGLGDRDQTFGWLNKGADMREPFPGSATLSDPLFDSVRSDPRYTRLLTRIGLK
jgi:hypothetical protein